MGVSITAAGAPADRSCKGGVTTTLPLGGRWSLVKIKFFFHIEIDNGIKVMYYIEKENFDNKIVINEKANKKD